MRTELDHSISYEGDTVDGTYVQVPRFWFMYVDEIARSSSFFRSFFAKLTGIGCLGVMRAENRNFEQTTPTFLPQTTLIPVASATRG